MKTGSLAVLSLLFVMLWSSGWVVSRFAVDGLSAMTLLSARYVIVFIVMLLMVTVLGHWRRLNTSTIVCHLLIGALTHAAYLLASVGSFELGVSAGLVAFITALQPMITASLSGPITDEKSTRRQWQGLLLGLCAVMLLVSDGYNSGLTPQALILPFVAVMSLSVGTLLHKRYELRSKSHQPDNVPVSLLLLIHSAGALAILLPLSASRDLLHFNFTLSQWLIVLWLALVVSLGAYGLLLILLRNMPTMQVASLSYLVPPATLLQAYLIFGNHISLLDAISLCIAALGVYLVMKPIVASPGMPHSTQTRADNSRQRYSPSSGHGTRVQNAGTASQHRQSSLEQTNIVQLLNKK